MQAVLKSILTAAVFTCIALLGADAIACSFPDGSYSVSPDIPDRIPARGAIPVVFYGTHESITPPLEDPNVTFVVRNSNDKPIPGDSEFYLVGADHSHPWGSEYEYLVAWSATDGWTPGETYTLTLGTTPPYGEPETLEHTFTAVDTSGDVVAPTVSSVNLSVTEDRAASDCCVPNEDVIDTCTGRPAEIRFVALVGARCVPTARVGARSLSHVRCAGKRTGDVETSRTDSAAWHPGARAF